MSRFDPLTKPDFLKQKRKWGFLGIPWKKIFYSSCFKSLLNRELLKTKFDLEEKKAPIIRNGLKKIVLE